jgi:hypothetical protein
MKFKMADKYYRMKHSYEKMKKVSTNYGNSISLSEAKEATEEFFTHCYHFKDWLKKELPHLSQAVEDHITKSVPLSLSADYCNTFKHAGLDRKPRSEQLLVEVLQHTRIDLTPKGFVSSAQVEIKTTGGKTWRAFDLATDCIRDWDAFLRTSNITIPDP